MVRALCKQQAPNKHDMNFAMSALRDVHPGELRIESRAGKTLDSIIVLVSCGEHNGSAYDVR
jgi:hypothetical protein